ncbi:MAG: RNA polymerase factor sigma-54 [Spirochaetes bacterium]|nr:RNA polymerase factor sigma-54 [Spirochaetota bacterium]
MNPQLYQSLKIMELPVIELRERIEQELENNPALELLEDRSQVSLENADDLRKEEYDYFETSSDSGRLRYGSDEDSEEHRRFIEGVLTRPQTLQEHLLWQLQLEPVDNELRTVAATLIQNLDDDGFHKAPPETIFNTKPKPARLSQAMQLVRGLDPQGTCCANYKESLKIQFALSYGDEGSCEVEKILEHLDLVERGKFAALAKIIKPGCGNTDIEELRLFCEDIKRLNPFPGRAFSPATVRYVVPDVHIVKDGGDFVIVLNDEAIPVLGISSFFEKLSGLPNGNAANDFVKENLREARLFIQQLNKRNLTLLRVVKSILDFQKPFFMEGPKRLAPLTLSSIARDLSMHESTVSRCANGKYIQCEWGIFELRYFFANSVSPRQADGMETATNFSKGGIKEIIKEIIAVENRRLSDKDITDLLQRRGIALARRTVAKYRKELDVGSSYTR